MSCHFLFILKVSTEQIPPVGEERQAPQALFLEREVIYKMCPLENNAFNKEQVPSQPAARVSIQWSTAEEARLLWNKAKSLDLHHERETRDNAAGW